MVSDDFIEIGRVTTPPVAAKKASPPRKSSVPRTGTGTRRAPAKRAPLTLAAQVTSGDFAIAAPGDSKQTEPDEPLAGESDAATTVVPVESAPDVETALNADDVRPPVPSLSPDDAALKFETMPEAPEQRSMLDDQEPMRFVWSKRWPFLTLASTSSSDDAAVEPRADAAPDTQSGVVSDQPDSIEDEAATEAFAQEETTTPAMSDVAPAPTPAPEIVEPEFIEPEFIEPGMSEPDTSPETIEPETIEPETAEPETIGPETAEPEATEPGSVEPATALTEDVNSSDQTETAAPVRIDPSTSPVVLQISGLTRRFGDTVAVDGIELDVHEGSFYGIVGPNGAGKTTTLSMITGLLRPDAGSIYVHGVDVWADPDTAKRSIGVLPDRLRLFDRLTGAQLLYYSGVLRGLDNVTVRSRVKDLAKAFGLEDALNRLVTDYSAGMTKKVALAAAMIHSPRLLVLDEPFESVDPVSAANVIEILQKYVAHGGTVVLSSHGMDLIQRVCDHVAIVVNGQVLASGAVDDVRGNGTLEDRFVELAGGRKAAEGMEWLHSFSD